MAGNDLKALIFSLLFFISLLCWLIIQFPLFPFSFQCCVLFSPMASYKVVITQWKNAPFKLSRLRRKRIRLPTIRAWALTIDIYHSWWQQIIFSKKHSRCRGEKKANKMTLRALAMNFQLRLEYPCKSSWLSRCVCVNEIWFRRTRFYKTDVLDA